jgi:hypothetical protein
MKERQIEAMYRAQFDERRHATEALDNLYTEAAAGRDTDRRAWLIGVACPRVARFRDHLTREDAREIMSKTGNLTLSLASRATLGIHPLESVERSNLRPGLRRWVAVNTATDERSLWRESWASIHHDGSVSLATAVGGHRMSSDGYFEGRQVQSATIDCAVADLMALTRITAEATGNDEYEVRVGIDWTGTEPLMILTTDNQGFTYEGVSTPLHRYTPVEMTVNATGPGADFHQRVHDLAQGRNRCSAGGCTQPRSPERLGFAQPAWPGRGRPCGRSDPPRRPGRRGRTWCARYVGCGARSCERVALEL